MKKNIFLRVLRRGAKEAVNLLPIRSNKVFVSSYFGRGYGDNPKYIIEELLRLDQSIHIVWLVKDIAEADGLPAAVKPVLRGSLSEAYHMATSKVWLDNCRRIFFRKRKKQFYIQTWHGFALKRIEADVQEHLDSSYVQLAMKDSKAIDLIVSEADFMTGIYQNAFWYDGKVVRWGSPRNDVMLDPEKMELCADKVRRHYNLDRKDKIVLYAPTFRTDHSLEPYKLDFTRVKEACQSRFGGEFKVFVRLHPNIVGKSNEICFGEEFIVNASYYPDMQELLAAADVVISDYSSLMFDFALSEKPCFQFATDIEDYKKDRNFYFALDRLPFSLGQDNDMLAENILAFDQAEYKKHIDGFFADAGMERSGKASKKCAELICGICHGNIEKEEILP